MFTNLSGGKYQLSFTILSNWPQAWNSTRIKVNYGIPTIGVSQCRP
ncbi:unnamed protein product [Acanthoscelides obtectus]|uniref:Uncharacterized protein n=1 Tax=Acanthoscelides obtectus TaxID=200917 RepID=A0A9P0K895_ACAOB|nr:unnamed protein product [Acanthoscelides obtectus]CAK1651882.1 hypothetical protein AOBTE_LOCUS17517 [Acanthoscelides obtectus]